MAEVQIQGVPFLKLNGGLNTETSSLNIPPTDASDLSNVELFTDGSVRRREGIDFLGEKIAGGFYGTINEDFTIGDNYNDGCVSSIVFSTLNSTGDTITYLIIHVGLALSIYDFSNRNSLIEVDSPLQQIDLSSYADENAKFLKTQFLTDRDKVFIFNEKILPGYIYLNSSDVFDFVPLTIFTRDLDNNPSVDSFVSNNNKSYLCIKSHTAGSSSEPGVGSDWKIYWVLYGPVIDEATAWSSGSGYSTNIAALSSSYFSTAAFSGGRLFLSGHAANPNTVYFSQTIQDDLMYGRMYQFADPLSTVDSELVASDGGKFNVNGAERIINIVEYKNSLLIFANNGIWILSGATSSESFDPTSFSMEKISSSSIIGKFAYSSVEEEIVFAGYGDIYITVWNDIVGKVTTKSISSKINNFYTSIPISNRKRMQIVYNFAEKRIYFLTNFIYNLWNIEKNSNKQPTHFRDLLVYDVKINSWFKYSLSSDTVGNKVSIGEMFSAPDLSGESLIVIDSTDAEIFDSEDNNILAIPSVISEEEYKNYFIFIKDNDPNLDIAFGELGNGIFIDFSKNEVDAESFTSFFVSAFQLFSDISHTKQPDIITFVFEKTESGILDDDDIDVTASGCFFSAIYDWASTTAAVTYTDPIQVYKPDKYNKIYGDRRVDGYSAVCDSYRIEGAGKILQMRFDNDGDKNFILLGLQVMISASQRGY